MLITRNLFIIIILWNMKIQAEKFIEHLDIDVPGKKDGVCYYIDISCPFEKQSNRKRRRNTGELYRFKVQNHDYMLFQKKVEIFPSVIGA